MLTLSLDNVTEYKKRKLEPIKRIVKLKIDEQGKIAKIGNQMEKSVKKGLIDFLCNNYIVMPYVLVEMKCMRRDVIVHRFNVRKVAKVVKQKKEALHRRGNK